MTLLGYHQSRYEGRQNVAVAIEKGMIAALTADLVAALAAAMLL